MVQNGSMMGGMKYHIFLQTQERLRATQRLVVKYTASSEQEWSKQVDKQVDEFYLDHCEAILGRPKYKGWSSNILQAASK